MKNIFVFLLILATSSICYGGEDPSEMSDVGFGSLSAAVASGALVVPLSAMGIVSLGVAGGTGLSELTSASLNELGAIVLDETTCSYYKYEADVVINNQKKSIPLVVREDYVQFHEELK